MLFQLALLRKDMSVSLFSDQYKCWGVPIVQRLFVIHFPCSFHLSDLFINHCGKNESWLGDLATFCHNQTKIVFAKELTGNEDKLTKKHDRFKCEKIFWMIWVIGVYSLIFGVYMWNLKHLHKIV